MIIFLINPLKKIQNNVPIKLNIPSDVLKRKKYRLIINNKRKM